MRTHHGLACVRWVSRCSTHPTVYDPHRTQPEDPAAMSIKDKAYIVGIYEHPTRLATDKTVMMLHAEVAAGALADAGLTKNDIDGYFCAAGDTPGLGQISAADYLGLKTRHIDSTGL